MALSDWEETIRIKSGVNEQTIVDEMVQSSSVLPVSIHKVMEACRVAGNYAVASIVRSSVAFDDADSS